MMSNRRQIALALATFLCFLSCANAVSERTRLENAQKFAQESRGQRRLSKSKSESSDDWSPVEWHPAMSPAYYYAAGYGTEPPTKEPTREPTRDPTREPTIADTPQPTENANIFDESSGKDGSADEATMTIPHHVVVKVSVALSRSVRPVDIQTPVAKITTKVIRSYTPFVVYMLDGSRRRELQPGTGLEYDPKYSSISNVFHSNQASWWAYSVAYKVNGMPEEVEEASEIDDLADSAVEDSILSGLFEQLLTPIAPEALGVSVPGKELNHTVMDDNAPKDPPRPPGEQPTKGDERRRGVGIGLAILCFAVIIALAVIVAISQRRRRRAAEAAWAIPLGEEKETGQIVSADWEGGYNGDESFESAPPSGREPPGSYMFGRWEDGTDVTANGTDEMTDAVNASSTNLSIHSSSSFSLT